MRPDAAVDPLGVEVRVGQKGLDPSAADGLLQRHIERHQVRARPATGHGSEDHVGGAIDHEDDLREFGVSRDLVAVPAARAALDVVPAGVPRFQASVVDSGQRDASLADPVPQRPLEHRVEQLAGRRSQEQSAGSLLEGGEVGHGFHPDLTGDIGVVHEVLGEAAVVESQELLEHQARQQLGLGKLLEAELVSVRRDSLASSVVRDLQDSARGFARSHISYYVARFGQVRRISTEHVCPPFRSITLY